MLLNLTRWAFKSVTSLFTSLSPGDPGGSAGAVAGRSGPVRQGAGGSAYPTETFAASSDYACRDASASPAPPPGSAAGPPAAPPPASVPAAVLASG